MNVLKYKSTIGIGQSEVSIEFRVNERREAYMETVKYKPEYIKSFIIVLNNAVTDLANKGFTKIVQTVSLQDWIQFLSVDKSWTVRHLDERYEYVNIEVPIENAVLSITKGLGFT